MNEQPDQEHEGARGGSPDAGGDDQPATGPHGDHDEGDFQPFEDDGLERREAGDPVGAGLPPVGLVAKRSALPGKDRVLVVQGNEAGGAQHRLAQPAQAEEQQEDADDELQKMKGDAVEQGTQRCDQQGEKPQAGQGAEDSGPPATQRADGEHDREGLDDLDQRRPKGGPDGGAGDSPGDRVQGVCSRLGSS